MLICKYYTTLSQIALLLLFLINIGFKVSLAHNPHDVIEAAAISPNFSQDQTIFIAPIYEGIFKSIDGGISWKLLVNGLDNTGPISNIVISPSFQHDKSLFVSTIGDGIFRSNDGGMSWLQVNEGLNSLNISFLAISIQYATDKIVLAIDKNGVVNKSNDQGETWHHVNDLETQITTIAFGKTKNGSILLAGDSNGSLYESLDRGDTWKHKFSFQDSGAITSIAFSPVNLSNETIFIGTEKNGIFKFSNEKSFVSINSGLSDLSIQSLSLSPNYETDSTILASTWSEACFISKDGGTSWKLYNQGITTDKQADSDRHKSPHFRGLHISKNFENDRTVFLTGFDGLFKSINGGHEWKEIETLTLNRISGIDISSDGNSIAITTTGKGVYISNNQGQRWTAFNKGLNTVQLMTVAFSPNYPSDNTIFVSSEKDFAISTDGGSNWNPSKLTDDNKWNNRVRRILRKIGFSQIQTIKDRRISSDIIAPSPNFASDNIIYLGTRYDGVFQTYNKGKDWNEVFPAERISDLVISHSFKSDNTLFAYSRDGGILRSADGGQSFKPINSDLNFKYSHIWQSNPQKGDLKLRLSPNYKNDENIFAGTPEGLFKSNNGGKNWQRLNVISSSDRDYIMDIAISPEYKNDKTIITSVRGKGLFKSFDGGENFFEIGAELICSNFSLERIMFSPSYKNDLKIFGTTHLDVFLSKDMGKHWEKSNSLFDR